MRVRQIVTISIIFFAFVATAFSQTVDEIIKKHIEALGSIEKIEAIKSLKITGVVTRGRGDRVFEIPFTRYFKRPNLVRNESEMRGMTMIQAYDGETAWGVMPFRGNTEPQKLSDRQAQSVMQMADIGGPLVNYKSKGYQVELIGKEEFEGTDVFKLKISENDSSEFYSYLDAEYYLEIKRVRKRVGRDGDEFEVTLLFSDFTPVNGVMIPHSVVTQGGGFGRRGGRGGSSELTIEKVEVNIEMEDGLFKMPTNK